MTTEQHKVSLTIETDWSTYQYIDDLSKTLEHLKQNIQYIEVAMRERLLQIEKAATTDPTEWLEDVEEQVAHLTAAVEQQTKQVVAGQGDIQNYYEQGYQLLKQVHDTSEQTLQRFTGEQMREILTRFDQTAQQLNDMMHHYANEQMGDIAKELEKTNAMFENTLNSSMASQMSGVSNRLEELTKTLAHVQEQQAEMVKKQYEAQQQMEALQQQQATSFTTMKEQLLAEFKTIIVQALQRNNQEVCTHGKEE